MNRLPNLTLLAALLLALMGCGDGDDLRVYNVPKLADPPPALGSPKTKAAPQGAERLLAAIVPRTNEVWHFKVMGPAALVTPQYGAFVKFVEGIKFTTTKAADGSDVTEAKWTLPEGWTANAGSGMRYATILIGERAHGLELTVFRFGPESGDILGNVSRWAGQVGVGGVNKATLADMTRPIVVADQTATLVDVSGPGGKGDPSMARPGPGPGPVAPPASAEKLVATAPQGWRTDPNPGQFIISKYDVTQDGKTASLTISRAGGQPIPNINRWRGQIGLTDWDQNGAMKAFDEGKELAVGEIANSEAMLIDIIGPEAAGDKRERIIGAMFPSRTGETWFIKFRGPADLITAQKPTFDSFLKSVKME